MSSNMRVKRICEFCQIEFIAKTSVTRFCGDGCAKRAYKARQKSKKMRDSDVVTQVRREDKYELIKSKEFLSVAEVAILLTCSKQNVYKMINRGKLKAKNLLERKTIVRRSDLDQMFE